MNARSDQSEPAVIPTTCERRGCAEPVVWVLRYDLIGAPEPAYACWRHGQVKRSNGVTRELAFDEAER